MNKGKRVFILLFAVILLVGVYFTLTHFLKDEDETDNVSVNGISVVSIKSEDIVGIHYIYGEEDITLVKDSDLWYLESDKKFPLNQTFAAMMASEAADLSASRLISETSEDFAEYGLSEPTNAIEYTLSNGSKMTYFFGDYNGFSNSYYFNIFGEEKIYLVSASFFEVYEKGLSDLADVEDITAVSTEEIKSVSMILDGKSTKIFRNLEGLKTVYTDNYTWFSNGTTPLNSVTASEFAGLSVSYNVSGCADYHSEKNELSLYGLNNPVLTLSVDYTTAENEEKTLKLFVGGQNNDGRFYAKTDDTDIVYLIDADYIENLRSFDMNSLRYSDVCLFNIEEIKSMTISVNDETSIKLESSKDEFNNVYSEIESMISEGITDKKVLEKKAFINIVFELDREGFSQMTMKFIPFDRSFYVVDFNGRCDILVNKRDVESLSLMIESMKD